MIQELRIGNWVKKKRTKTDYYTTIQPSCFSVNIDDNYEKIPLTEQWLLKFGFFKYNNAYVLEKPKENTMDFSFSVWQDMTYNSSEFPVKLDYVHQLQNLYFALIGSELQVVATKLHAIIMNPYEPILEEIANGFLETAGQKPNFSNNAFLDATFIFQTVLMDKLFDFKPTIEDTKNCGNDLRKLIIKYTGLDPVELVKNYEKK